MVTKLERQGAVSLDMYRGGVIGILEKQWWIWSNPAGEEQDHRGVEDAVKKDMQTDWCDRGGWIEDYVH